MIARIKGRIESTIVGCMAISNRKITFQIPKSWFNNAF